MLLALLDGRSLSATELAERAGVTCQTASSHLARLTEGQLLQVIRQGRHRYYRIANTRLAELLESMARLVPKKTFPAGRLERRSKLLAPVITISREV